jgi:hypothetical protein
LFSNSRLLGKVANSRKSGTSMEANKTLSTKSLENKKHETINLLNGVRDGAHLQRTFQKTAEALRLRNLFHVLVQLLTSVSGLAAEFHVKGDHLKCGA